MYVSEKLCLFVVLYSVTPEDEQNPKAMWSSVYSLFSSPIIITKEQIQKLCGPQFIVYSRHRLSLQKNKCRSYVVLSL
jgi:hypothetical protein